MAVVQYTFTHKQYTEQHKQNTQNRTYVTIRIHKNENKRHNLQNYTEAYKTYDYIYIYSDKN